MLAGIEYPRQILSPYRIDPIGTAFHQIAVKDLRAAYDIQSGCLIVIKAGEMDDIGIVSRDSIAQLVARFIFTDLISGKREAYLDEVSFGIKIEPPP